MAKAKVKGADLRASVQTVAASLEGLLALADTLDTRDAVLTEVEMLRAEQTRLLGEIEYAKAGHQEELDRLQRVFEEDRRGMAVQGGVLEENLADLHRRKDDLERTVSAIQQHIESERRHAVDQMERARMEAQGELDRINREVAFARETLASLQTEAREFHAKMGAAIPQA